MGPQNTSTSRDCAEGALAFLSSVGIARDGVAVSGGEYSSESGYSATMGLLARPDPVTAIMATNDTVALGVLEAAKRHGVEVPRQLSELGLADIPLAGSPLIGRTTIRQPVESMTRLAARRLVERLELRGPAQRTRDFLPVYLVQRKYSAGADGVVAVSCHTLPIPIRKPFSRSRADGTGLRVRSPRSPMGSS